MARLLSAAIASIQCEPRWRHAPVDQPEAAKDAVQDGIAYLLKWREVRAWKKEDLFRVARKNMKRFLEKHLEKALRRMEVAYPNEEPFVGAGGGDEVTEGTAWSHLFGGRTLEAERDVAHTAEERAVVCAELLEAIAVFLTEHTRMSAETKADILRYVERCCDSRDDVMWVTESGNIRQREGKLADELRWPKERVRKTRSTITSYRKPILVWLKAQGYEDQVTDALGSD